MPKNILLLRRRILNKDANFSYFESTFSSVFSLEEEAACLNRSWVLSTKTVSTKCSFPKPWTRGTPPPLLPISLQVLFTSSFFFRRKTHVARADEERRLKPQPTIGFERARKLSAFIMLLLLLLLLLPALLMPLLAFLLLASW